MPASGFWAIKPTKLHQMTKVRNIIDTQSFNQPEILRLRFPVLQYFFIQINSREASARFLSYTVAKSIKIEL